MESIDHIKTAVVGCGAAGGIYLKNLTGVFSGVQVIGVCDLDYARAEEKAREYGIPKIYETLTDILEDESIQLIVNLTPPAQHAPVTRAALEKGKHVYSKGPPALSFHEGTALTELAKSNHLLLGCGPDTHLGAGLQTGRKLLDDGFIGSPAGSAVFAAGHSWTEYGIYCVTALVALLGPARCVTGVANPSFPSHVSGAVEFEYGAVGNIFIGDHMWPGAMSGFEIYGSEGTLSLPGPGQFGGPVRLRRGTGELMEIPLTHGHERDSRGIGVADMARALHSGKSGHRTSAELSCHVLEIMEGFLLSAQTGRHVMLQSSCRRPEPLPTSVPKGHME